MPTPVTEHYWFKLKYKESEYVSIVHDSFFDTIEEARKESARIIAFHKETIEKMGDIYEQPELTIYWVSGCFDFTN